MVNNIFRPPPLLEVQHLSVGIEKGRSFLPAVNDISFTIAQREILGIVGESGCGKTLTALAIPGLLPGGISITRGSVVFENRDLAGLKSRELWEIRGKSISMIFQEPMTSLNPLLKIGRQIAEPLELHGYTDKALIRREVLDIMGKVGLPDPERLAGEYPHQLSGGMRQRVMIALAMICKPKLLIADEPTTALDVTIQAQLLRLMKWFNKNQGTSILFISHDLALVSLLCDRVLVMYAGKLVEEGLVQDIFSRPSHEYTKGLIGAIPSKDAKGRPLVNIPGKVPSIEDEEKLYGCPFAPRCSRAEPRCASAFPDQTDLGGGHYVRCFSPAGRRDEK
ncbi:MAG: ABC transporter ATP-binding protein [Treponema sp.]|nr:ABC transporter ATP-binding protein [Treponema sp.]